MRVPLVIILLAILGCGGETPEMAPEKKPRPSILLVTLDTTRFDSIGPDANGVSTPAFNALAARGIRFTQAYATAPQTLPSHASMLTGLYPAAHGIHENARYLTSNAPLIAEKLRAAGYRTAAFVSAVPLSRQFGLARGFDVYDDRLGDAVERSSEATTQLAIAELQAPGPQPRFVWVHYFDPHAPYGADPQREPEEAYRKEIELMDRSLGALVRAFDAATGGAGAIIIAADHGEGLGDHGEREHGALLYQSVMHVPLVVVGSGTRASVIDRPVSTRRVFHTLLDFAGVDATGSLRTAPEEIPDEVIMGEAMAPFLDYGWQPQVMAVEKTRKVIQAGAIELYDVIADPNETNDLSASGAIGRDSRKALVEYPIPSATRPAPTDKLTAEEQRQLASLGYVTSDVRPVIRPDATRPVDMVHLFDELDRASRLFSAGDYKRAIPVLETILEQDPHNLMAALRIAAAHSSLGNHERATEAFERAREIAPQSEDVRYYLALHYARTPEWKNAVPMLEQIVAETPERVLAIEALADIRLRQGRAREALELRLQLHERRTPTAPELIASAQLAMSVGDTANATSLFERASQLQGTSFKHHLELGVLYLAARRYEDARAALDRVPKSHPQYAMALFKRAQVSVLLNEPDRAARIAEAREHANTTTRELIENERLFR